jgi:Translation initiation factor 2, alpha subunit (eIF-2alpha)|nr:MAG: translation initiation factor 2, alpha subunit, eIF-2alpha [Candidatus Nanosalinarum sp. J07AB56]
MEIEREKPEEGDFVVIEITEVDKNSAYAELEEYDGLNGIIHISEVARSWVDDASNEISEGEKTVAQVVDSSSETVDLSLKRVNDEEKRSAMERMQKRGKAEDYLEEAAQRTDAEDIHSKAKLLREEFGSVFHAFEVSVARQERLKEAVGKEFASAVQEVAKDNIDLRQEKLEGEIELRFTQEDGASRVSKVFSDLGDGVEATYISAPEYRLTAWGRNTELAKEKIDDAVLKTRNRAEELGGSFEFERA